MNCRTASSVCGAVGFAAMLDAEAREPLPPPSADEENEDPRSEEDVPLVPAPGPPVEEGSCGGWCRRRKRAPEGVRKAVM